MAQQIGSSTKLVYKAEPAAYYKQVPPAGADAHVLSFVSESLKMTRNLMTSRTIRSDRNPKAPVRGNVEVGGDINFELAHQYGKMLHMAFGSYVAASGETSQFSHTYKLGTLPSFTVEKQFTDLDTAKYFQYSGCRVNSFKVSIKSEGFIDCTAGLMGAKETVAAAAFASSPTDLGHDPFDGFQIAITEGGSSLANATEIEFTIENNLDGSNYVIDGTGERKALPSGTAKVTGTLTALFENVTLYTKAINHTETSIVVTLTRGTGAGTVDNEKLTFTFPEVVYQPDAPAIDGPTGLKVTLPFECYYDGASEQTAAQAVLLSSVAHYG